MASRKSFTSKLARMRRLGEILVEEGFITEEQLSFATEEHSSSGGPLTEILISQRAVTEWEVAKCLTSQLHLPFIYTKHYDIPSDIVSLLPHAFLHQHRLVPMDQFGDCLVMATAGNITEEVVEEIELSTKARVMMYIALSSDIQETLQEKFPLEKLTNELSEKFDQLFQGEDSPFGADSPFGDGDAPPQDPTRPVGDVPIDPNTLS